jgi:hypothetical protein
LVFEHYQHHGGRLGGDGTHYAERLAGTIEPAKDYARDPLLTLQDQVKDSTLFFPAREDAEYPSYPLQLGGGGVAQEPSERPIADQGSPILTEEAETDRTAIH